MYSKESVASVAKEFEDKYEEVDDVQVNGDGCLPSKHGLYQAGSLFLTT